MQSVSRRVKQPRWQPYTQSLPTPATSLHSSSPPPTATSDRKPTLKSIASIALIERAVASLSDIWPEGEAQTLFALLPHIQPQTKSASTSAVVAASTLTKTTLVTTFESFDSPAPMPLRTFVHELLRRSRTSLAVLQTALCYLEAAKVQVPELRRTRARFLDQPTSTITVSEEYAVPSAVVALEPIAETAHPLLCARRTFLASLLLAHKFTADKAFSNKAWARLACLPPREVGRCERALGGVLGWRLWVGKPVEEPKSAALCRSPTAPATGFFSELSKNGVRSLRRAVTEPSLDQPTTTTTPAIRIREMEAGQRTIRVTDEDDESGFSAHSSAFGYGTSSDGSSSIPPTPALSDTSSSSSGSSSSIVNSVESVSVSLFAASPFSHLHGNTVKFRPASLDFRRDVQIQIPS